MKKKNVKLQVHDQKTAYLFILPSMLILTVFVFVPLISAFVISLLNMDIYMKDISFAGLGNFIKLFRDERVWNATKNTFVFTVIEVPLQVMLALVLTMFMQENRKLHKFLRASFYVPYVCSMTAISILWSLMLNPNSGMFSYLLKKVGITLPNMNTNAVYAMAMVIAITVWRNFGYTLTILTAATLDVPAELYEAAKLDGATGLKRFWLITVPCIRENIVFCMVTVFILAFQAFDQIYVLTGGGPQYKTETLVSYIYDRGFNTGHDLGYASAISVYLLLILAVITQVMRKLTDREEKV
jgi:multiple sugar transport system permease protein